MLPAIKCLKLMKISEEDIKVAVDKYLKQKGTVLIINLQKIAHCNGIYTISM